MSARSRSRGDSPRSPPATHLLAGDVGGTKADLALYELVEPARPGLAGLRLVAERTLPSRDYGGLAPLIADFLGPGSPPISAAAFGIPGPVVDDVVVTTNLPWRIAASELAGAIGCPRVALLNDLETTAWGALALPPSAIHVLHDGVARPGNVAVIAAGTGLGQAFLFWDGARFRAAATEGGHVDFAPRDELEIGLLSFLRQKFGRVSYERVVSGPGLANLFDYFDVGLHRPVAPAVRARIARGEDVATVVGEAGVDGSCATCAEVLERFVSLYGAQAGNLALTVMAVGGVWIGGGIVTKILPRMTAGGFLRSFRSKGRYEAFMERIPVKILLEPKTSRLGAALAARRRMQEGT